MNELRVLQLCHKPPRPSVDGGCLAMDSVTQALIQEGHDLKVLSLSTHKHPFRPEAMDASYLEATGFEAIHADTELNVRDAASHLVTGESYHLSRFHVPEMEQRIEAILRETVFDVVLLESLFVASYIPAIRRLSDADVVLRAHNVEHRIWEDVTEDMPLGPKRWILRHFQHRLKDAELSLLQDVDAVVALTHLDADWFETQRRSKERSRVLALPYGLGVEATPHQAMGQAPSKVLHLGSMDWTPNVQGVEWLLQEVWPEVRRLAPGSTLELAGRHMPSDWVSDTDQGVIVLGEVESASDTYDSPAIVVVPLHAGSGMRIKVAEALAAGRPLVTTSKGMEGLALVDGEHALVADDAQGMAQAIASLLQDGEKACRLGQAGRAWAMEHLDRDVLSRKLTAFLNELVKA